MWTAIISGVLSLVDKIIPDPQKAAEAKLKVLELQQNGELKELEEAASIVRAEAQGESTIQRTWRPIVMLTFTALIVFRWLGVMTIFGVNVQIDPQLEIKLFDIVQLGLGGYVIGRSAEKVVKEWKK